MNRWISSALLLLILTGCGQGDSGPAHPAADDQFYVLFFGEVTERGEEWWGYPPPESYCVAIAPGSTAPDVERSRDPVDEVLDGLRRKHRTRAFHPYSACTDYPFNAPGGEPAGLLWVAPLETTDRVTVSAGWNAERDWTEWGCTFGEIGDSVGLHECSLWSET